MDNQQEVIEPLGPVNVPVAVESPSGPQLVIELATTFPKPELDKIWPKISGSVESLAKASKGEFTAYTVYHALLYGTSHLYMGYLDDAEKTFVGFMTVKYGVDAAHIWNLYIEERFRNSNVFDLGLGYLMGELKKMKVPCITASVVGEWSKKLSQIGFEETFRLWRRNL